MYSSPYPLLPEFLITACIWMAVFNLVCLVATVVWWASSDRQLLRKKWPGFEKLTSTGRRQILGDLRASYSYSRSLPLFVDQSPLRYVVDQSSAPSLGAVLVVLVLQSIPLVSLFTFTWYSICAVWHVFKFLGKQLKEKTPAPVRRLLFTTWF